MHRSSVTAQPHVLPEGSRHQMLTKNRNRWGLLTKEANVIANEIADMERKEKSNRQLQWSDFDHQYTMELGNSAVEDSHLASVLLVFEKADTSKCLVLNSCTNTEFTPARKRLVDLARDGPCASSFLTTKCVFDHDGDVYVGSEYSDISLAEIIDGPFDLKEEHVAVVLHQLASSLLDLQECGAASSGWLVYGELRAQNVFVGRNGKVKLASFGKGISQVLRSDENRHIDRRGLGGLAVHMITRSADELGNTVLRQKMLSFSGENSFPFSLEAKFEPSPNFIDFLLSCFTEDGDLRRLSKHPFLRGASSSCSLIPFSLAAERLVLRACCPLSIM